MQQCCKTSCTFVVAHFTVPEVALNFACFLNDCLFEISPKTVKACMVDSSVMIFLPDFTDSVVHDPHLESIPLLILANKQDIQVVCENIIELHNN